MSFIGTKRASVATTAILATSFGLAIAPVAAPSAFATEAYCQKVIDHGHVDFIHLSVDANAKTAVVDIEGAPKIDDPAKTEFVIKEEAYKPKFLASSKDPSSYAPAELVGKDVYYLGQSGKEQSVVLFPGFETTAGNQLGYTSGDYEVTATGPGAFYLWRDGELGGPIGSFKADNSYTFSGVIHQDSLQHEHMNWAATAPGVYTFTVKATLSNANGEKKVLDPVTYHWRVSAPESAESPAPLSVAEGTDANLPATVKVHWPHGAVTEEQVTWANAADVKAAHAGDTVTVNGTVNAGCAAPLNATTQVAITKPGDKPESKEDNAAAKQREAELLKEYAKYSPENPLVIDNGHRHIFHFSMDDTTKLPVLDITLDEDAPGLNPANAIFKINEAAKKTLPNNDQVPADLRGKEVYYLGAGGAEQDKVVFPGFDTDEITDAGYEDKADFKVDVQGPGSFYLWKHTDAPGENDSLLVDGGYKLPGTIHQSPLGHAHLNWAATAQGDYTFIVTPTVYKDGKAITLDPVKYRWTVGDKPAPKAEAPAAPAPKAEAPAPKQETPAAPAVEAPKPVIALDHPSYEQGAETKVTLKGFTPNAWVNVVLHSTEIPVGKYQANDKGEVSFSYRLPADLEPGKHEFIGTNVNNPNETAKTVFTVDAHAANSTPAQQNGDQAQQNGDLAQTGADYAALLATAGVLVAAGAGAVALRARRRNS